MASRVPGTHRSEDGESRQKLTPIIPASDRSVDCPGISLAGVPADDCSRHDGPLVHGLSRTLRDFIDPE